MRNSLLTIIVSNTVIAISNYVAALLQVIIITLLLAQKLYPAI